MHTNFLVFTIGAQPFDHVAYNQFHKKTSKIAAIAFSVIASRKFVRFQQRYKKVDLLSCMLMKTILSTKKSRLA